MRKVILTTILATIFGASSLFSFGQVDQKVADLLNRGDYLELSRILPSLRDSLHYPELGQMAEAGIYCSFNEPYKAVLSLSTLLNTYGGKLGAENFANFIVTLSAQLIKLNKYDEATSALKVIIDATTDEAMLAMLKSQYNLVVGLSKLPKSEVARDETASNRVKIVEGVNGADHHWYIPAEIGGRVEPLLFDTGAGGNTLVSREFAARNNIKIRADSIMIRGMGRDSFYVSLGVIDTLKIGNIVVTNMPIYVGDMGIDSSLIVVDAIIGSSFMESVGAIKILPQEMEMVFVGDVDHRESDVPNMMNFSGNVAVDAYCKGSRFLLFCDTGSRYGGWINESAYDPNAALFEVAPVGDSIKLTGFGGVVETINARPIKSIQLTIGDTKKEFTDILLINQSRYDGMLGVEFFKQYDEVTFDLKRMYLHVK